MKLVPAAPATPPPRDYDAELAAIDARYARVRNPPEPLWRAILGLLGSGVLALLVVALAGLAVAETRGPMIGQATAVDGDTLRLGDARIRLFGIDAPESRQTCFDAVRAPYACGEASTRALRRMLARDPLVTCQAKATDRYGRTVAVCRNGEGDLGARLVATGMAIRYERYAGEAYRDEEAAARAERLGIWAGSFEQPEQYRRSNKR